MVTLITTALLRAGFPHVPALELISTERQNQVWFNEPFALFPGKTYIESHGFVFETNMLL